MKEEFICKGMYVNGDPGEFNFEMPTSIFLRDPTRSILLEIGGEVRELKEVKDPWIPVFKFHKKCLHKTMKLSGFKLTFGSQYIL